MAEPLVRFEVHVDSVTLPISVYSYTLPPQMSIAFPQDVFVNRFQSSDALLRQWMAEQDLPQLITMALLELRNIETELRLPRDYDSDSDSDGSNNQLDESELVVDLDRNIVRVGDYFQLPIRDLLPDTQIDCGMCLDESQEKQVVVFHSSEVSEHFSHLNCFLAWTRTATIQQLTKCYMCRKSLLN